MPAGEVVGAGHTQPTTRRTDDGGMHELIAPPSHVGPYRIERRLGAGGMAETFVGVREGPAGFSHRVCIKRVLPPFSRDPELLRMFRREARLVARLTHRSVARVIDYGEDRAGPFLALELVEGMDLRTLLKRVDGRRLPVALTGLIGLELAEALAHAHSQGILHRDVSPANVLISVDGEVKLTDFGIARALAESSETRSGVLRGNPWYLAPELLSGEGARATEAADLYSLGAVLFECLAGTRPRAASTRAAALLAAARGPAIPLRQLAADVPEPLPMVVDRLMAREPGHRFASGSDVVDVLASLTPETASRRALGALVRAASVDGARRPSDSVPGVATRPEGLAAYPDLAALEAQTPEPVGQPAGPDPAGRVRTRWRPYVRGPGAWADERRALEQRRRHGTSAPSGAPIEPRPSGASKPPPGTRPREALRAGTSNPAKAHRAAKPAKARFATPPPRRVAADASGPSLPLALPGMTSSRGSAAALLVFLFAVCATCLLGLLSGWSP